MKSYLGLVLAAGSAAAFGLAYAMAVRPGAAWLDGQWLFLAALPYTWTWLHLWGSVDFSPDSPAELLAAAAFDVALAYVAGALAGAVARRLWRLARRG